jgi:hypothetical protein
MTREEHEEQLTEAISEFCKLARQTSLTLNEAMKTLEDLRRQVTAIGEEPGAGEAAEPPRTPA